MFLSGLAPECELDFSNNELKELFSDAWKPIFDAITAGVIKLEGELWSCRRYFFKF